MMVRSRTLKQKMCGYLAFHQRILKCSKVVTLACIKYNTQQTIRLCFLRQNKQYSTIVVFIRLTKSQIPVKRKDVNVSAETQKSVQMLEIGFKTKCLLRSDPVQILKSRSKCTWIHIGLYYFIMFCLEVT